MLHTYDNAKTNELGEYFRIFSEFVWNQVEWVFTIFFKANAQNKKCMIIVNDVLTVLILG